MNPAPNSLLAGWLRVLGAGDWSPANAADLPAEGKGA